MEFPEERLVAFLAIRGCQDAPPPGKWRARPPHIGCSLLAFFALLGCSGPLHSSDVISPQADHVIIVSIDGGRMDALLRADTPALQRFVDEGAYTFWAETDASRTLPSHASMLTGTSQSVHEVDWNKYDPGKELKVETVFELAKTAGRSTAIICSKLKLRHLTKPGSVDFFVTGGDANEVIGMALKHFKDEGLPNLTLIHFSDVDSAGHATGWGSSTQASAIEAVDHALARLLETVSEMAHDHRIVIIVTADHGGHLRDHGSKACVDRVIPWLVWGNGIRKAYEIQRRVKTYDTAATALWLLGIPHPYSWQGHPVEEILSTDPAHS